LFVHPNLTLTTLLLKTAIAKTRTQAKKKRRRGEERGRENLRNSLSATATKFRKIVLLF
jgi:hypothetical protein